MELESRMMEVKEMRIKYKKEENVKKKYKDAADQKAEED
jgi:hypothetical protein